MLALDRHRSLKSYAVSTSIVDQPSQPAGIDKSIEGARSDFDVFLQPLWPPPVGNAEVGGAMLRHRAERAVGIRKSGSAPRPLSDCVVLAGLRPKGPLRKASE